MNTFPERHFSGAELKSFLCLALPTIVSTGTDAVLGFGDRLFLSNYQLDAGEAYLNAGLVGGVTSFLLMSFFIVTTGYSNALVAQFLGAKKSEKCARVISQTVFFSFMVYPIILLMGVFIGDFYAFFNHSAQQLALETQYTQIILFGAIITVLRSGFGGFFIGIQKTKVVMYANVLAMVINLPLNYMMIFGVGFFPELGIVGAALATVISGCIALITLLAVYFSRELHKRFQTRRKLIFDPALLGKLLRFGLPSGVETFFGVAVFDFFLLMMNSYGETVGAAVTIAISWDSMFFIPMMGAGFTTTSLVGHAMGAKNVTLAQRYTKISLFVMLSFALLVTVMLAVFPEPLAAVFLAQMSNAQEVKPLAIIMLRLACLYLFFDAFHICFSSALRGAGDTKMVMVIFLSVSAMFAIVSFAFIFTRIVSPVGAWLMFVGFALALGTGLLLRFRQGKWKTIVLTD